jgi:hypothetical protein
MGKPFFENFRYDYFIRGLSVVKIGRVGGWVPVIFTSTSLKLTWTAENDWRKLKSVNWQNVWTKWSQNWRILPQRYTLTFRYLLILISKKRTCFFVWKLLIKYMFCCSKMPV